MHGQRVKGFITPDVLLVYRYVGSSPTRNRALPGRSPARSRSSDRPATARINNLALGQHGDKRLQFQSACYELRPPVSGFKTTSATFPK